MINFVVPLSIPGCLKYSVNAALIQKRRHMILIVSGYTLMTIVTHTVLEILSSLMAAVLMETRAGVQ